MLTRRQKIIISSLLLATGLFSISSIDTSLKAYLTVIVIVVSFFLSAWSIYGKFSWLDLVNLFVLPTIFTASLAIFLGEFELSLPMRVIFCVVYIVVMYTILLAENIFFVSTERNIPLVRAARTVGYLATLFVSFAFFTLLYGLRPNIFVFSGLVFFISSLLVAQGIWQINLRDTDVRNQIISSLVAGFLIAQTSLAFGFWPLDPPKIGLVITSWVYVFLGILQHQIKEDLTKMIIFEYVFVSFMVIVLLFTTSSWGV